MDTHTVEEIHDVFLSFRGDDTRRNFTSHLHSALSDAVIHTFIDDNDLFKGGGLSRMLLKAIQLSRCNIVIFSQNYANSSWCLNELVKIMECCETMDTWTLPVFLEVSPSDVRHQRGRFGKLFNNLMRTIPTTQEMEEKYRKALTEAANLAGWDSANYKNQSQLVKDIVEEVTCKINNKGLFLADYPVGIRPLVQEVISKFGSNARSNDVLILGLWGMGGIGKTTIAKAIFNALSKRFKRRSFIANIREVWRCHRRQDLQEQLLCDIGRQSTMKIHSIDMGKDILKKRLQNIRALLLLDDVNDQDQLKALCGNCNWFAPSSVIIITTRDKVVLHNLDPNYVHKMREMEITQSLEISRDVVAYCGGLPLSLEVIGSYLFKRLVM